VNELLVLAALLSAPDYRARDAATRKLADFGPAALPVLDALAASPDPEVATRAAVARPRVLRASAERFLTAPGAPGDAEVRFWAAAENRDALACAAARWFCPPVWTGCWPLSWSGNYEYERSVRAVAGWCRNQANYPPGMRWPWVSTWELCLTGWKW
jgi:hypothetical protein